MGPAGLMAGEASAQLGSPAPTLEPGAAVAAGRAGRGGRADPADRSRPSFPGTGSSRTPLQLLEGTITPNDVHLERHYNGIPAIEPGTYELLLHGLVRRPLVFRYEDLLRYLRESRLLFIVYLFGRRADKLEAALAALGGNARAGPGSVTDAGDLDQLYDTVKQEHGKLGLRQTKCTCW